VSGVEPYPLTYVEYAIAPAQPLQNADCTPDSAGQTALSQWLNFLVGGGQNDLPAGMVALPSSLVSQAQADIAKVVSAAAACSPVSSNSGSGSSAASPGGAGSGGSGSANPGASASSLPPGGAADEGAGSSTSSTSTGGAGGAGSAAKGAATPTPLSLAAFETVSPASWALPLLAVLVLTLLLPGLILLASGRSLTEALGGLRSGPSSPVAPFSDPALDGGAEP
jgi:hypothetical protein